jgi:hypothetical protein
LNELLGLKPVQLCLRSCEANGLWQVSARDEKHIVMWNLDWVRCGVTSLERLNLDIERMGSVDACAREVQ